MSVTAQSLYNYSLTILAQASDTVVAGLPDGLVQDEFTTTSQAQILLWLSEAQNRVARLCVPIFSTATITASTGGQVTFPYTAITDSNSRILHRPSNITVSGSALAAPVQTNVGILNNLTWFPADANNNPTGWADNNSAIAFSAYSTTATFSVSGYFLPAPITSLSQTVDPFLDDFSQRLIAMYTAWMIAVKNMDNGVLVNRAQPMFGEFANGVKEVYTRLVEQDPTISGFMPPEPIDALVQLAKSMTVRS